MQIEHLRYFIMLSQYQSINKTSKALYTTPQNVSRILKGIEHEMETELFFRSADGITLTPAGISFLEFAKKTVYQFDTIKSDIQFNKSAKKEKVEIILYSSPVVNEVILTDILLSFSQKYPDIVVNNILTDWQDGYEKIQNDPSAIAFLSKLPNQNILSDYDYVALWKPQAVAVISKKHKLVRCPVISFEELLQEKLILLTQSDYKHTEFFYILSQLNISPSAVQISVSGSLKYCYQLASTGEYICPGVLQSFLRQPAAVTETLLTVPISNFPELTTVLIKSKHLSLNSAQYLLFSFILNYIQNNL